MYLDSDTKMSSCSYISPSTKACLPPTILIYGNQAPDLLLVLADTRFVVDTCFIPEVNIHP